MNCVLTNDFAPGIDTVPSVAVPIAATGQEIPIESSNRSQVRPTALLLRETWRVEDYIGYELTMVPEVECVIVEKDDDFGYSVYTVVNERDLDVRSKIYDREMEILAAHPGIGVEFNILSRRNRPIESVVRSKTKPYKRPCAAAQ